MDAQVEKKYFCILLCQCCPFLLSCICTCPQWKRYLQAVFYVIAGNDYLLIVHWREFPWRPCSPYHPAGGPFVLLYALQSGVIHHPSHCSWGPYGLEANYEAMRKIIIFAETAILCSCSLYHPSFLVWDNERVKATGIVFVLWIQAERRKYNQ